MALRNFARSLAAELIGRNIQVNAVSPGVIETPLFGKLGLPEAHAHEQEGSLWQRSGSVSNVSNFCRADKAITMLLATEPFLPADNAQQ